MASLIWLDMSDGWCQILMANIGKYENCQPFDICKILEVTATIQDRPSQQLQNFPNVHKTDDKKKHWAVDLCILWGGNEAVGVSIHVFGTPISVQSHVQLLQATSCAWTSFAGLTPNWSVHQPSPSHVFHELSYIQMIDTLRCNVNLRPPEIRSCEWLESQNHPGPEWILLRCGSQTQVSKMNILREVPLQKCRNVPEKKSYERSPTQSKVPQKISWIRFFKRKPFVGSSIRKSRMFYHVLRKFSEEVLNHPPVRKES